MWSNSFRRKPNRNNIGSIEVAMGANFDRNLKIVNGVTGEVFDSINEQRRKEKLKEQGAEAILDMVDPYMEILKGIKEMGEFFPTKDYRVITTGSALLTIEEIRNGYYIQDEQEFRNDYDVFKFKNEVRVYLPLLEIVRLLTLGYSVSLVDKSDLIYFYQEIERIVYMTDEVNYPSYNRLPYNRDVVEKLREMKKDIEDHDSWIFYKAPEKNIVFGEKGLGMLLDIVNDINTYQNTQIKNQTENMDPTSIIRDMVKYKKRT